MTSRVAKLWHRNRDVVKRVAHAVADRVAILQFESGVIEDKSADSGDLVRIKSGDRIDEPVFIGDSVVVDERDELAGSHVNADIPRYRQVALCAGADTNPGGVPTQHFDGIVGGRTVHDDDFEVQIVLP